MRAIRTPLTSRAPRFLARSTVWSGIRPDPRHCVQVATVRFRTDGPSAPGWARVPPGARGKAPAAPRLCRTAGVSAGGRSPARQSRAPDRAGPHRCKRPAYARNEQQRANPAALSRMVRSAQVAVGIDRRAFRRPPRTERRSRYHSATRRLRFASAPDTAPEAGLRQRARTSNLSGKKAGCRSVEAGSRCPHSDTAGSHMDRRR